MIIKLLTEHHLEFLSLKGGSRGSSESTHIKMPHCWKSHPLAHMCLNARKPVFGSWRTAKAQTSLCIRAVCSAPLFIVFWKAPYLNLLQAKSQFSS